MMSPQCGKVDARCAPLTDPGLAGKCFTTFNCVENGAGIEYLRADLSLPCSTPDGGVDATYAIYTMFAVVMIIVHVVGYPAVYAYLFFKKFREPLAALCGLQTPQPSDRCCHSFNPRRPILLASCRDA